MIPQIADLIASDARFSVYQIDCHKPSTGSGNSFDLIIINGEVVYRADREEQRPP